VNRWRYLINDFVTQGLLYGSNKEYNVFLAVPDMPAIRAWAAKQPALASAASSAPGPEADAQLMALPEVQRLISDEVRARISSYCTAFVLMLRAATVQIMSACGQFKPFERPHKWAAIMEPFSQVGLRACVHA
jgi:long-subunit acyl-CoA synthetase (AMP-forming)